MIPVVGVLFILLWRALDKNLFGPYLKLLEAREAATEGAHDEAHQAESKAAASIQDYQERMSEARRAGAEKKLTLVNQAKAEADRIIAEAEAGAQEYIEKIRAEISQNIEGIRKEVMADAEGLAEELCNKASVPPALARNEVN